MIEEPQRILGKIQPMFSGPYTLPVMIIYSQLVQIVPFIFLVTQLPKLIIREFMDVGMNVTQENDQ